MTWQPIETAPKDIEIDLWVTGLEGGGWRKTGRLIASDPGCMVDEEGETYWPHENGGWFTHWQPLPSPPET